MGSAATNLVPPTITVTLVIYLAAFFILDAPITPPSDTSGFGALALFVGNLLNFLLLNLTGIPGWLSFILFMVMAVPWAIIITDLTGTAGSIITLTGLLLGAVVKLFQWVF